MSRQALANDIRTTDQLLQYSYESTSMPADIKEPTVPLITIPTSLSGGEVCCYFPVDSTVC